MSELELKLFSDLEKHGNYNLSWEDLSKEFDLKQENFEQENQEIEEWETKSLEHASFYYVR
jgi:hypothetical protein